jgi:hypothetical protein
MQQIKGIPVVYKGECIDVACNTATCNTLYFENKPEHLKINPAFDAACEGCGNKIMLRCFDNIRCINPPKSGGLLYLLTNFDDVIWRNTLIKQY